MRAWMAKHVAHPRAMLGKPIAWPHAIVAARMCMCLRLMGFGLLVLDLMSMGYEYG